MTDTLRPHHVLCLLAFRGSGYSDAFTTAMFERREALVAGKPFLLASSQDRLCESCPNWNGQTCASNAGQITPDELDRRVLLLLGKQIGDTLTFQQVRTVLSRLSTDRLAVLCEGCSWRDEANCPSCIAESLGS